LIAAIETKGRSHFRAIYFEGDKPDWYKEINEKGEVPSLLYGPDFKLSDSIPMVKWMEEKFKN
jgi:glutathione S-transferase